MKSLNELLAEKRTLIDRFIESYSNCRDCYNDDFEMQLCIEEDLACNEIYDLTEQETLARYIVSKVLEKESDTKGLDSLIENADIFSSQARDVSQSFQQPEKGLERE